jgi:sensor histidine kinase regulating citrate/malate metabolism
MEMKRSSRARQRGISFFGLIFVLAVLAAVGYVGLQAFPTAMEYQAVVKAMNRAKDAGTPQEVRAAFDRSANVDDIKSVTAKDLEITRVNDRNVVKVAYDKQIHMFGPAYLLLKYVHQTAPSK